MNKVIRKVLISIVIATLMIPVIGVLKTPIFNASDDIYDVCWINDSGKLEVKSSHSHFENAIKKMNELGSSNGDYVVTSPYSLSPSKIVAMNRGYAYSYPYRGGSNTQEIYASLNSSRLSYNSNSAHTYVAANNAMAYVSTDVHYEAGEHGMGYDHGYIVVNLGGFVGYTDLEYCDLVPMKYIENGWSMTLGGNSAGTYASSRPKYNTTIKQNYYYINSNGNYVDLVFKQYYTNNYTSGQQATYETSIGPAPDFMKSGVKYYSNDGVNFYTDHDCKKFAGVYYNYYQFLPARTYTKISASTINSYIKSGSGNSGKMLNTGNDFISAQNKYGFNAVLAAAIGIHESGWGKSDLAVQRNNLFGIAAYDSSIGDAWSFNSVYDCICSLMGDVLANYLDVNCSWYYSYGLGTKGGGFMTSYASDPYWAEEISHYYYEMDKADNGNNGKLTDYNTENLYLVDKNSTVYKSANTSGGSYYNTQNKFGYQKNLIVPVVELDGKFAKIRTSCPIENGKAIHAIELSKGTLLKYNADTSYGYISTSNLTLLYGKGKQKEIEKKPVAFANTFDPSSNSLELSGVGFIYGVNFSEKEFNDNLIEHELIIESLEKNNEGNPYYSYKYPLKTSVFAPTLDFNDGYNYSYVSFSTDETHKVDLSELPYASYLVYIRIKNGDAEFRTTLTYSKVDPETGLVYKNIVLNCDEENSVIRFSTNQTYNSRVEIDKCKTTLDFSLIKRAKSYPSFFNLFSIDFDSVVSEEDENTPNNFDENIPDNEVNEQNEEELSEQEEKAADKVLIKLDSYAFMYGLDSNDTTNPKYRLHFVNYDSGVDSLITEYEESEVYESGIDYGKLFGFSNDLSNICFKTSTDISKLEDGDYLIILEINVKDGDVEYLDYAEVNNYSNVSLNDFEFCGRSYKLSKSDVRSRIVLTIKAIESGDE